MWSTGKGDESRDEVSLRSVRGMSEYFCGEVVLGRCWANLPRVARVDPARKHANTAEQTGRSVETILSSNKARGS